MCYMYQQVLISQNTLSKIHIPIYAFVIKENNFKSVMPFLLKTLPRILD